MTLIDRLSIYISLWQTKKKYWELLIIYIKFDYTKSLFFCRLLDYIIFNYLSIYGMLIWTKWFVDWNMYFYICSKTGELSQTNICEGLKVGDSVCMNSIIIYK